MHASINILQQLNDAMTMKSNADNKPQNFIIQVALNICLCERGTAKQYALTYSLKGNRIKTNDSLLYKNESEQI